jgi:hypothetical protein
MVTRIDSGNRRCRLEVEIRDISDDDVCLPVFAGEVVDCDQPVGAMIMPDQLYRKFETWHIARPCAASSSAQGPTGSNEPAATAKRALHAWAIDGQNLQDKQRKRKEPNAGGGCVGLLILTGNWEEECCQSTKERWEEECASFEVNSYRLLI